MTSTPAAVPDEGPVDTNLAGSIESSDPQQPPSSTANESPSSLDNGKSEGSPTATTGPKGKLQTMVLMIALCVCIALNFYPDMFSSYISLSYSFMRAKSISFFDGTSTDVIVFVRCLFSWRPLT